jgi:predicted acyltransferase
MSTTSSSRDSARPAAPPTSAGRRIAALDQFRGYTIAGMLLVNFLGGFAAAPAILQHHHTYCSYADTIMPQFFFAVGFAYRLTLRRRLDAGGSSRSAYGHAVRRALGLILLGLVIYHLDGEAKTWRDWRELGIWGFLTTAFQRRPFQTLVHIGLTSLWVLPVIAAGPKSRGLFLVASALSHILFSTLGGYANWAWERPVIDGGPLGFLSWTIPLLIGAWACDLYQVLGPRGGLRRLLIGGSGLMLVGYALSCLGTGDLAPPPFVPPASNSVDAWTMSQRMGTVSYLTFAAGFSALVFALFVVACDLGTFRLGLFRTLGGNALATYILHELVNEAIKPYVPRDAPAWFVLIGLGLSVSLTYLFIRSLERQNVFIKL